MTSLFRAILATQLMMICLPSALADQLPGITEFQDNTPAVAKEVNDNNMVLSDKAQDLEARVKQLEDVSDRLVREDDAARYGRSGEPTPRSGAGGMVKLVGGKRILYGVDCSQDPHALAKAYQQNTRYSYLAFYIIGECYGHFTLLDSEGVSGSPPYPELQEHGQVVTISSTYGEEGGVATKPKLVPHPVTNMMSLIGSFGGGLYINNVDVDISMSAGFGVLFSRGTTGDLGRSTVTCLASSNTVRAVVIQNGAAPYLYGVTIKDCDTGIMSMNNTATTIYGDITIANARIGINLFQAASLNTRLGWNPVFNIEASDQAISLSGASQMSIGTPLDDLSGGYEPGVWSGGIVVKGNSSLEVAVPVRWSGSGMLVESSSVTMSPISSDGSITDSSSYASGSGVNPDCRGASVVNILNLADPDLNSMAFDADCSVTWQ